MRNYLIPMILASILMVGCNGPRALTKRALELQSAGLGKQAAEMYYQALRKKPGSVDAMVGLRSTGQGVMDGWVGDFQRASMDGRRADALKLYDEMLAYQTRISMVNVELLIPTSIVSDYEDHLDEHLIDLDEEGHSQLDAEEFEAAAATFREILRLDPEYGDARALLTVAEAEPEYREGNIQLAEEHFRAAHSAFGRALGFDPEYKDAQILSEQALEEGRLNMAILTFESSRRHGDIALELRSAIENGLIQTDDPFIGIVDRTQREEIMAEQELSISGISDEQVEVGGLAGARAMLSGAVLMYTVESGSPISTPRSGFRKYFKEVKNDEGKTTKVAAFAPAQYVLHSQRREVIVKYELKLVSTETSEILFSEVDEVRSVDEVQFATSQVNAGSLYPARANGEVNRNGKSQMNRLLGARRELIPESTLRNQILQEAARRGVRQVESFLATHIE